MDSTTVRLSAAEQLYELLATEQELPELMDQLARVAAHELSGDFPVLCGITLGRYKRATSAGSSSERAKQLDEIQAGFDEGPCLEAQQTGTVIRIDDAHGETRWPDYMATVREAGLRSILAIPLDLEEPARAALNCYTADIGAFGEAEIATAKRFVDLMSRAMRVALRVARHAEEAENRRKAMESRTSIDIAVGIVMSQSRCSQDEAFDILVKAASSRNVKLRKLAEEVIAATGQPTPNTVFDE